MLNQLKQAAAGQQATHDEEELDEDFLDDLI